MKFFRNQNLNKEMKNLNVIVLLILTSVTLHVVGQENSHEDRWEKYRTEKIAFLTDKLELSPKEAQKFWPVYNQMDKERWQAQISRRELEGKVKDAKETLSEKEIINLTREYAGGMQKEAEMIVKFNEEFLKILSAKKVLKLYQAENEFRMHMIRKFRDVGRNENPPKQFPE